MSSKAMKIVMQYSDSDEELSGSDEHPLPIRDKRASFGKPKSEKASSNSESNVSKRGLNTRHYESHRAKNSADPSEKDSAAAERQRRDSDWAYDDEYDNERENDNDSSELKEPPPPARPDDFRTCSPSPTVRSPTPAPSTSSKAAKLPRIESQLLVAYGDAIEDNDAAVLAATETREQKRRSQGTKPDDTNLLSARPDSDKQETSDGTDRSEDNTPATTATNDEFDPYAMLDKCLEKDTVTESAEQSPSTTDVGGGGERSTVVVLPPEPTEKCSAALEERFVEFFRQKYDKGTNFNSHQLRKDFRNPSIYEKLIEHFGLDELGSNFEPEVFNPHGFRTTDFYDEIAKAQRSLMDKVEKEKGTGTSTTGANAKETAARDDSRRRKSKWDNPENRLKAKN